MEGKYFFVQSLMLVKKIQSLDSDFAAKHLMTSFNYCFTFKYVLLFLLT
jgi:hypothetical protein